MAIEIIRHILAALLLLVFQVFLIQEINFSYLIKPMPYVYLLLVLPFSFNKYLQLAFAFALGFLIDILSDTYGMNTSASLLLVFIRNYWDETFDKESMEREGFYYLTWDAKGPSYYFIYIGTLVFSHHLLFFILQYFKFSAFFKILSTTLLSTIITLLILMIIRLLFQRRRI